MIEMKIEKDNLKYQILPFFIEGTKLVFSYEETQGFYFIFYNNIIQKWQPNPDENELKITAPNTLEEVQEIIITFEYLIQRLSIHKEIDIKDYGLYKTELLIKKLVEYIFIYKRNSNYIESLQFELKTH
jgi:hypothetical protein